MLISYHGHSIVRVKTKDTTILMDPFITGNDLTDLHPENEKPDVIILTHGHGDHVGDTLQIAQDNQSLVIAPNELAVYLGWKGLNTHGMNIGGAYSFDFGKVKYTPAFHSSAYTTENNEIIYMGMPAGVLLTIEGKTIYHAGDTALFSDMKLIGEQQKIDLAFLPIGDNFTMGPEDAAIAAKWIGAKTVVPIHYDTFPPIKQNPQTFIELLDRSIIGKVMKPGDSIEI